MTVASPYESGRDRPRADRRGRRVGVCAGVVLTGLFGAVAWKLAGVQRDGHDTALIAVVRGLQGTETRPARRGAIVDAAGRPLAISTTAFTVALDPQFMYDLGRVAVKPAPAWRKDDDPAGAPPAPVEDENAPEKLAARYAARLDATLEALNATLGLTDAELARVRESAHKARADVDPKTGAAALKYPRYVAVRRLMAPALAEAVDADRRAARDDAARLRGQARDRRRAAAAARDAAEAERLRDEADALSRDADRVGSWYAGVRLDRDYTRAYPQGRVAAHVLGFTDDYGRGLEGIERFGDAHLTGVPVKRPVLRDAAHRPMAADLVGDDDGGWPAGWTGQTLELSIESVIQCIAQEELAKGIAAAGGPGTAEGPPNEAITGSVVVMDPFTGDVLAMTSFPDFDPNHARDADPRARRNDAIATTQEPGSVMKPFVYAAAFERGLFRFDETIDCSTYRMPNGRTIRDIHPYGSMTAEMALIKSSNPGAVKIGERLGLQGLHDLTRSLGFGTPTTVVHHDPGPTAAERRAAESTDAPGAPKPRTVFSGELGGLVRPFAQWNSYTLGSVPMGYEIAVTPLQVAAAYCVFANGGWLPTPRIVRRVRDPGGVVVEEVPVRMRHRVFREDTVDTIRAVLRKVVTQGTGRHANDRTYAVAGKSGTANLPVNKAEWESGLRGYSKTRHTTNFVGMAPADAPRLVVSVSIRESTKYGGAVSGPVTAAILRRSLAYLHQPPTP